MNNKTIAVMTSGGDAPGMNAAIRAVVRTAIHQNLSVFGIYEGYNGLINGEIMPLNRRSVGNIIQKGGTFLKTSRCQTFKHKSGRRRAANKLEEWNINGLIVIGGDGSFKGAHYLHEEQDVPVIGIPATIDNDIYGTDQTIGYDTAVTTALDSIDKIRDTAASHNRLFIVEVMGRDAGFIAQYVGIAGGAEEILVPERKSDLEELGENIKMWEKAGKGSSLIVVAEGDDLGNAHTIAKKVKEEFGVESRICILGHTQRGGSPSAADRLLASRLGYYSVKKFQEGEEDVMLGWQNNEVNVVPLTHTWEKEKKLDKDLVEMYKILAS